MELVILMGLQGAGKSTFYRTRFADTHVHISKDNFRNASNSNRQQQQLIEAALGQGRSAVIDNTSPSPVVRAPLIALGRSFSATIIGYYFESNISECLERNSQRLGLSRVPDIALCITMQQLTKPTYSEGFDYLYHARSCREMQFEVQAWEENQLPG